MNRAKNIPSSEEETSLETKRVLQALSANNYLTCFLRSQQSNTERETNANMPDHRGLVILPCAKGCSEKNCGTFKRVQNQGRT